MSDLAKFVAEAFVSARRDNRTLPAYPGPAPSDLASAYRIQSEAIVLDGRTIGGWKVGRIPPAEIVRHGTDRLAGPIFAETIVDEGSSPPVMPIFEHGFAAVEAEFLLHVAPGLAGSVPANDAETLALLDDVRIGMEIASSPYPGINTDGPAVTVSDFGNNAGIVVGQAIPGWREIDLREIVVRTAIDGETVGEASAATMLDGPLGAVRFLLANLATRGFDMSAGGWVSSGAVTGVHPVLPGQHVIASFADIGSVECSVAAARGR